MQETSLPFISGGLKKEVQPNRHEVAEGMVVWVYVAVSIIVPATQPTHHVLDVLKDAF